MDLSPDDRYSEVKQGIELLIMVAQLVEPVKHRNGRIKLKVPLANLPKFISTLGAVDVERLVALVPGLKDYRVNPLLRSATIEYDPSVLSRDLWEDFCRIKSDGGRAEKVRNRLISIIGREHA